MIEKPINEDLEFFNDMVNVSVVFMIEESVQTLLFFTIFFVLWLVLLWSLQTFSRIFDHFFFFSFLNIYAALINQ
jgi:hypothetical protein